MTSVRIEVFGEQAIDRTLTRAGMAIDDARPAWLEIMDFLTEVERRQFASGGSYGSGGWAPLAPSTLRSKQAAGYPDDILVRTGRLKGSLSEVGHGDQVREASPTQMLFGSSVEYGAFHQAGTAVMPRRRPVQPPGADRRDIVKILQRHIVENR